MKRRLIYVLGLLAAAGALVTSEIRQVDAEVAPTAIMYFVADAQHELTRLPVRFTRISDGEEIRIGTALAKFYAGMFGVREFYGDDKEMAAYVEKVGMQVAVRAQRKLPYKFYFVARRDFVNAFALPGGGVFVGAGLVEQLDSEDQLAAILAHEVEHIDHYHTVERLQLQAALRKIPFGVLLSLPAEIFQAGYSKEQELEADLEGMKLAVRAGYSAEGAVRAFDAFLRLRERAHRRARTPGQELSQAAVQLLVEYFRSHPEPEQRQAYLRAAIAREPWLQGGTERDLEVMPIVLARRASDAIEAKQYERAAVLARKALALRPEHVGALTAHAQASFALRRFAEATASYKAATQQLPSAGAAIRTVANRAAGELIAQQKHAEAVAILQELLKLQPGEPITTGSLAYAQAQAEDLDGAAASAAQLRRLYPHEAEALARRMIEAAQAAMRRYDFAQAAAAASVAAYASPQNVEAPALLADARFAQARFREAADRLKSALLAHKLFDTAPLRAFADALAATDKNAAAAEFEPVIRRVQMGNSSVSAQARCELAGLQLLAGDPEPAAKFAEEAQVGTVPPELLVRLAWWHLRAGDPARAAELLEHTMQLRPGDIAAENLLAWAELELDRTAAAHKRFETLCAACGLEDLKPLWNTPQLGRAVALWRLGKKDEALKLYPAAVASIPQWKTESWRNALHPPKSVQAVAEMSAEHERRRSEARARMRRPVKQ